MYMTVQLLATEQPLIQPLLHNHLRNMNLFSCLHRHAFRTDKNAEREMNVMNTIKIVFSSKGDRQSVFVPPV